MKYGILRKPHQNARYFESTKELLKCEFEIMAQALKMNIKNLEYIILGGVELLSFDCDTELSDTQKQAIYRISSNFILFEISGEALRPLNTQKATYFKDDISSILKYSGKTNEAFTAMCINAGVFSSHFALEFDKPLNILDPMCGRGTTLYESLIRGYNASGVEIKKAECQEIDKYLKRYLKYHRYKHSASHQTIRLSDKSRGVKYTIETADTIENFKAKDRRIIQFANGNTFFVNDFYKKDSFHVIVADIPYGVQHKGGTENKPIKLDKLMKDASKAWKKVLKSGGTVVVAFNAYTLKREELVQIFENEGYEVLKDGPYERCEHWVEQAVNRDIFIARKR